MGKKVGNTVKRFGARYGATLRKRLLDTEQQQKAIYECPKCGMMAVKRKFVGVWSCTKCGYTFTGGAYAPQALKK
ncbi:MAG: 50S ribosomal protein L37ae [Nitrososphaerota archaeon]